MADPLGVDTSLMGNQGQDAGTGVPLLDNPGNAFLSGQEDPLQGLRQQSQQPTLSQSDFQQIVSGSDTPMNFSGVAQDATGKRAGALKFAKQFLGTPYKWGGTSPAAGFDCSGLVQYVWKKFGMSLPRLSQQQAGAGQRVALNDLKPMDLVLFNEGRDGVGHVAFWLGNGQILEAPHTGAQVRIRKLGKGENVFGVHLSVPG